MKAITSFEIQSVEPDEAIFLDETLLGLKKRF